jgi:RNA-binding protein YhbY
MNDNGLDQLFGNAADGGDFPMEQAHLDQALGMIQKEKRRPFFIWWWMGSAVVLAIAVWMWSPWSQPATPLPSPSDQSKALQPMAEVSEAAVQKDGENIEDELSNEVSAKNSTAPIQEQRQVKVVGQRPSSQDKPTMVEELASRTTEDKVEAIGSEFTLRTFNDIDLLESLSPDLLGMDLPALSRKDIYQSSIRLPLRWNVIFEVNNYDLNSTSAGIHGGRIGLSLIKPLSPRTYMAVEPMLAWSTDFADDHLLLETSDYGLEVRSRAFRIRPDLVISGQVNLHIGWATGRWKLQTGPSLFALPWAQGEIYELDVDQGQWTDIAKVGSGRLESDLSEKWSWGWSGTALYHVSPKWHLGLAVNFQDRSFFQKGHYEGRSDSRLNIGLRTQYLIGS